MEERRLCHRPDFVCLVAGGFYGPATRNQARDRLPGRHAKAGRQLADALSIDPRWFARQLETIVADHLRRQLLGHARAGATCAEERLSTVVGDVLMIGATRLPYFLLCGLLMNVVAAAGEETKSPAPKA